VLFLYKKTDWLVFLSRSLLSRIEDENTGRLKLKELQVFPWWPKK
jgi:hypothetical protein